MSHHLSQKDLASALRVHRSTITRWMRAGILRPNEHYFRFTDRGPLRFNLDRIIESCKIATYLRESI
ncbi:helix-turn-helix domain-containing protein [Synechococcus sp. BS56D]|uniref:helix-turn-helix domain-containing protein n=1 Tax=Synechococcus sp. BS56D TaxID=2055944 RepID=UPI0013874FBB